MGDVYINNIVSSKPKGRAPSHAIHELIARCSGRWRYKGSAGKAPRGLGAAPRRPQRTLAEGPGAAHRARHCCAQRAALLLSPSRPFQGTIPTTKSYFYTTPASPGSWQAGALAQVPGSSSCSRTISKPRLCRGAAPCPVSSQGPFSCSARAPTSLRKPHPSTPENLFPS